MQTRQTTYFKHSNYSSKKKHVLLSIIHCNLFLRIKITPSRASIKYAAPLRTLSEPKARPT